MDELLTEYQNKFAHYVHAKGARATGLGRQALVVLLKAIGIQPGDNIGVCAFTCFSVIEAVLVAGGKPVYLDVDESLCIDPAQILRYPSNYFKAVILQHTFGNSGRLDQLLSACDQIHAQVIEDCAHVFGSYWNGRHLGSFGQGAIYSFQWGKPYTTGQGGMVTVNSETLLAGIDEIIREFARPQLFHKCILLELQRTLRKILNKTSYEPWLRNYCKRIFDTIKSPTRFSLNDFYLDKGYIHIQDSSTIREGIKQLSRIDTIIQERKAAGNYLKEQMKQCGVSDWPIPSQADISLLRYPFLVKNKDELIKKSILKGIDLAGWYQTPVHPLSGEALQSVGYKHGEARNAEKMIGNLVHLPTNRIYDNKRLFFLLHEIQAL